MSRPGIPQRDLVANALVFVHLLTGRDVTGLLDPLMQYFDGYVIVRASDLVPDSPAALTGGQR